MKRKYLKIKAQDGKALENEIGRISIEIMKSFDDLSKIAEKNGISSKMKRSYLYNGEFYEKEEGFFKKAFSVFYVFSFYENKYSSEEEAFEAKRLSQNITSFAIRKKRSGYEIVYSFEDDVSLLCECLNELSSIISKNEFREKMPLLFEETLMIREFIEFDKKISILPDNSKRTKKLWISIAIYVFVLLLFIIFRLLK